MELTGPIDVSTPPNYEQLYAQAMHALYQHELYYFNTKETQQILEWNRKSSVKSAAEQFFFDYFEPAKNENEGVWMSPTAIYNFLKEKVGSSLLKSTSVIAFGRRLSNIPELKKDVNKYSSIYLVRQKKP